MAIDQRILEIVIRAKDEATATLQKAGDSLGSFGQIGAAGAAITAVGVAGAAALNNAAEAAAAYGEKVVDVQRLTGASAEESSKWAAVLDRYGVSGTAAGKVIKTLDVAISGNSAALAEMGVAAKNADGSNRDSMSVMADVAQYYSTAEDKTQAVALASKVLGKGYMDLLPILANGKDGIDSVAESAKANGLILSQDGVDAAKKYGKAGKDLEEAQKGLNVQIGLAVLPIKTFITDGLAKAFEWFNKLPGPVKSFGTALAIGATALALIGGPILMLIGFFPLISTGFAAVGVAASAAWLAISWPVVAVVAAVAAVIAVVILLWTHWSQVSAWLSESFDKLKAFVVEAFIVIGKALAAPYIWLYEHNTFVKEFVDLTIKGFIEFRDKAIEIFNFITDAVGGFVGKVITKAKEIADAITKPIKDVIASAKEWGSNLINEFVQGIKDKVAAVGEAVGDVADKIGKFLGFHSPTKEGPGSEADQWAPNFISMYASGLTAGVPKIAAAMKGALSAASGNIGINASYASAGGSSASGQQTVTMNVTVKADDLMQYKTVLDWFNGQRQSNRLATGVA
jgi:hypothetical protein